MSVQMQQTRGTAAAWTSADPTLAEGQVGIETDTNKFKFGDGVTSWISLPYVGTSGGITALTGDVTANGPGSAAATIASDAVTNAKLANMDTQTIKGRTTAGTGDPEDLTAAQARAVLQVGLTVIAIAASDETTALTTGTAKATFVNPYSSVFNIVEVVASLKTPQTSGSIFTVDINEGTTPVSILSTKLTIDNTEYTGGSNAAAGSTTPAVISDASIAAYATVSVDIDQVGDGTAKGLKVYLIGYPS